MLYGIDASSAQGSVTWAEVAKSCAFGFEKVTQGTGYVNPYWQSAKVKLLELQHAGNFVPGAYLFLEHGNAAAQADFFVREAGNLDGWLIAIDGEPTGTSSPNSADLVAAVDRLRTHYPKAKIGGYLPHWYWGTSITFPEFDWLWASHYVTGSGTPQSLYASVPASWWDSYGGRTVELLQFTAAGLVSGASGQVDVSAYRGSLSQLKALAVKSVAPPLPQPVPTVGENKMYVFDVPKGKQIVLPVPSGSTRVTLYAAPLPGELPEYEPKLDVICGPSSTHHTVTPTWEHQVTYDLVQNTEYVAFNRLDGGNTPVTILFS